MSPAYLRLTNALHAAVASPRLAALGLTAGAATLSGAPATVLWLPERRLHASDPLLALDPARGVSGAWSLRAGVLVPSSAPHATGFLADRAVGVCALAPAGAPPALPLEVPAAQGLARGVEVVLFGRGVVDAGARPAVPSGEQDVELRLRGLGEGAVAVSVGLLEARGRDGARPDPRTAFGEALLHPDGDDALASWGEAWLALDARAVVAGSDRTLALGGFSVALPAGAAALSALLGLSLAVADAGGEGVQLREAPALPSSVLGGAPGRAALLARVVGRRGDGGALALSGGAQLRYRRARVPRGEAADERPDLELVSARVDGGAQRTWVRARWHLRVEAAAGPREVWSVLLLARLMGRSDPALEALARDRAFLLAFGAVDRVIDLYVDEAGVAALAASDAARLAEAYRAAADVLDRRRDRAGRDDAAPVDALLAMATAIAAAEGPVERCAELCHRLAALELPPDRAAAVLARLAGEGRVVLGELSLHDRAHGWRVTLVEEDAPQDVALAAARARRGLSLSGVWTESVPAPEPAEPAGPTLRVVLRTPHDRPIRGASVTVAGAGATRRAVERDGGAYEVVLPARGDLQLVITKQRDAGGFDHRTLRTPLFVVREGGESGVRVSAPDPATGRCAAPEVQGPQVTLRVRLEYLWFTAVGYPPTEGNAVDVLADGEAAWAAIADALEASASRVHATTWIYQPSLELRRTQPLAEPEAREATTIHRLLSARAAAGTRVRLLLWDAPFLSIPSAAEDAAEDGDDGFEVLEQANPTRRALLRPGEWDLYNELLGDFQIGSYHQKTVIVDGAVGFCGGMNMKENDWDSGAHTLFEPRRCRFERHTSFRERVLSKVRRSDHPPRHDFMARVVGPSVEHLEANFVQRWNHVVASGGAWSENATLAAAPAPGPTGAGPAQVQVVRTMPEPFAERGILDVYLRAIEHARELIYIEDQYFRSTYVSDAIADAVRRWPSLAVVVVTAQGQADGLMGGWTRDCFDRIRARRPDFTLYTLKVFDEDDDGDGVMVEVDNHAKLMIVDDVFLTVGSCNLNDRGFDYEGEINLAVVEPALAGGLRRALFAEHLGHPAGLEGASLADALALWRKHAVDNAAAELGGQRPRSHVFPFVPEGGRLVFTGHDVL